MNNTSSSKQQQVPVLSTFYQGAPPSSTGKTTPNQIPQRRQIPKFNSLSLSLSPSIYSHQQPQSIQPQSTQSPYSQSVSFHSRGFSSKKISRNYQEFSNNGSVEEQVNGRNSSKYFSLQCSPASLMRELVSAKLEQNQQQLASLNKKQSSQSQYLQKDEQDGTQAQPLPSASLSPTKQNIIILDQQQKPVNIKQNNSSSPTFFLSELQNNKFSLIKAGSQVTSSSRGQRMQALISQSQSQNNMVRPFTSQSVTNKNQPVLKQFAAKTDKDENKFVNGNLTFGSPFFSSTNAEQPLTSISATSKPSTPIKQIRREPEFDTKKKSIEASFHPFSNKKVSHKRQMNEQDYSQESRNSDKDNSFQDTRPLNTNLQKYEETLLKKVQLIDQWETPSSLNSEMRSNKLTQNDKFKNAFINERKQGSYSQNKLTSVNSTKEQDSNFDSSKATKSPPPLNPLIDIKRQSIQSLNSKQLEKVQLKVKDSDTKAKPNQLSLVITQQEQQKEQYDFDTNSTKNDKLYQFYENDAQNSPQEANRQNQPELFISSKLNQKVNKKHPQESYYLLDLFQAFKKPYKNDQQSQSFRQHFLQTCQGILYSNIAKPANSKDLANKKVVLGPRNKKYTKTIIFDMDETLMHCNQNLNIPYDVAINVKFPTGECIQAGINIRPFAKEILKELSEQFEIIIFTASHACYAQSVIEYLDPQKKYVHHKFFREQCIQTPQGVFVKDLRIFSDRQLQDIVLIDNAAYSFSFQIDNGIPILPFYNCKKDTELIHLSTYLHHLNNVSDVREYNRTHLKMFLYNNPEGPSKVFHSLFKTNM